MDKQSLPPSLVDENEQQPSCRFKITYCHSCGYRQRAVKVAAELDELVQESTAFVEGADGIFEIADRGRIIFSYKEANRFPESGEIAGIAMALDAGVDLEKAKRLRLTRPPSSESFEAWFIKAYGKPKKPFSPD